VTVHEEGAGLVPLGGHFEHFEQVASEWFEGVAFVVVDFDFDSAWGGGYF
jgi:hypothetical protein